MNCDPRCGLSWRMSHVHLRRGYILHLGGLSWRCQWDPSHLMYPLRLCFFLINFVLMICPLVWVGCKSVILLLYCCQFLLLSVLVFVLCTEVLLCWVQRYLQMLCLSLILIPWSYVVFFLICYNLYFKVYFVWYKDCYSSFLLFLIWMEYIFPSLTFSLYMSLYLKWVSCRPHIYRSCFCIHSANLCLLVGAFNHLHLK